MVRITQQQNTKLSVDVYNVCDDAPQYFFALKFQSVYEW